jgi:hypothetical protein
VWFPRLRSGMYSSVVRPHLRLRDAQFLVFVLKLVELPLNPALGQQFLVAADFAHVALVHHDDLVRAPLRCALAYGSEERIFSLRTRLISRPGSPGLGNVTGLFSGRPWRDWSIADERLFH